MSTENGGRRDLRLDQPHTARMYDYYLGGKDNYAVDREAADQVLAIVPNGRTLARQNRQFMQRAIRVACDFEVIQYLDIGTGIPTEPNLHQIAQDRHPYARVVYVDNDPLVLSHARALLTGTREGRTAYIEGNLTDPATILAEPALRETLDMTAPLALSVVSVLHFVEPEPARAAMRTLVDALPSGSYVILSHGTTDINPEQMTGAAAVYRAHGIPLTMATKDEFAAYFDGLELLDPGIVALHKWRPVMPQPRWLDADISMYAAVGRKP